MQNTTNNDSGGGAHYSGSDKATIPNLADIPRTRVSKHRHNGSIAGSHSSPTRSHNRNQSTDTTSSDIKPPEHLSEFFSFMNNKSNIPLSPTPSRGSRTFPPPVVDDKHLQRQPSLNTFTSFSPSVLDLPDIITSKDFSNNIGTYTKLLKKAESLRRSLQVVSEAANEFGQALEECITECPKSNTNRSVSDGLINAGGLQYMIGSNQQILSRLIKTSFEEPLAKEVAKLQEDYDTNHGYYQQEVKRKSKALREKELENLKLSKQKTRNLNTYKHNLMNLTNQLDEIDRLKYDYYHEINLMIERFNSEHLLVKTGSLVRAQLEIFEGIAKKGWSGGGLDNLLEISPDLFEASYDSDDNSLVGDDEREGGALDKSVSVSTLKQAANGDSAGSEVGAKGPTIEEGVSEIIQVADEDDYDEDTTIGSVRINKKAPNLDDVTPRDQNGKNLGTSNESFLSKITPSFGVKKPIDSDGNQDESFSLPVVSNISLLGSRNKLSDSEASPESAEALDHSNILDELED